MNHLEGYCDGIAGAGLQDRVDSGLDPYSFWDYRNGFILGSLDRKEMLKNNS